MLPVQFMWKVLVISLFHCSSFMSGIGSVDRPPSWCDSPTSNTMRHAMFSSQAGQREYLIKHRLGKKENEYVDIETFRLGEVFCSF